MPITQTTSFPTNVIISDALGTPGAPTGYFGFANALGTVVASTGPRVQAGTGNPNGTLTSPAGSLWLDVATGTTYRNLDGASAWAGGWGRLFGQTNLNDQVTAVASAGAYVDFASTFSLPASFFRAGTALRVLTKVRVNNASGAVTLKIRVQVGGQTLAETTAVDPTATTDFHAIDSDVSSYSAASAASPLDATSSWATDTGGTIATGVTSFDRTNFATNGALAVTVGALWSASNANTACILDQFEIFGG